MLARPFLKWAGGKGKLAAHIVQRAPGRFERYHEPFLGGGAVFFRIRGEGRNEPARLSDANAELVTCYRVVREETETLIDRLGAMAVDYLALDDAGRREHYYAIRAEAPEEPVAMAARMIFLNRTGYNGLYRLNRAGGFNVPFGRYERPRILDADGLRAAAAALERAEIRSLSFDAACRCAEPGDFVYLDPPYVPLSATASFTQYTGARFGPDEQEQLRDCFERLTCAGVACLLSNSDHEAVRELYGGRGYAGEVVAMSRAINSATAKRRAIGELLIDNFGRPEVRARFGEVPEPASGRRREL